MLVWAFGTAGLRRLLLNEPGPVQAKAAPAGAPVTSSCMVPPKATGELLVATEALRLLMARSLPLLVPVVAGFELTTRTR